MKIIHTADVHLDSKLNRHLDERRAKERRDELLVTFQRMVEFGDQEGVEAILIAGDLFDVAKVSATARGSVLAAIQNHPWITFYYLRGNHDAESFLGGVLDKGGQVPENLRLFEESWTTYEQRGSDGVALMITGAELNEKNGGALSASLLLDPSKTNIVMLHGQETKTAGQKEAEVIPLNAFRNRGIDYLALGHVHAPKLERLDARGVYAYAGCLEGRGFDECGPRGFYLLDVSEAKIKAEFIPFARRSIWEIRVDVTGCVTSEDALAAIRDAVAQKEIPAKDLVKVILTGDASTEAFFDVGYLRKVLEEEFYYLKIEDDTHPITDYESYELDTSLRGEYVRLIQKAVEEGKLTREEAAEMIRLGIRLLDGEEVLA